MYSLFVCFFISDNKAKKIIFFWWIDAFHGTPELCFFVATNSSAWLFRVYKTECLTSSTVLSEQKAKKSNWTREMLIFGGVEVITWKKKFGASLKNVILSHFHFLNSRKLKQSKPDSVCIVITLRNEYSWQSVRRIYVRRQGTYSIFSGRIFSMQTWFYRN